MRALAAVGIVGLLAMVAALLYGFSNGNGWSELKQLLDYPWFRVTIIDVYVGLALFACWIASRETLPRAACWIIALAMLGNLTACIYLLRAIHLDRRGQRPLLGSAQKAGG